MKILLNSILAFCFFLFAGCQSEVKESPTKGNLVMYSSESLSLLAKAEVDKFLQLYTESHIVNSITSDRECIVHLLNDSAKLIITARCLNDEERAIIAKNTLDVQEYLFAYDGVAFIVNKENPITQLRTTQLDSIFSGKITTWNEVSRAGSGSKIHITLPNRNSGEYENVSKILLKGKNFTIPSFVAQSTHELIDNVSKTINAIGFMSICWKDEFKSSTKILDIGNPSPPDSLQETAGNYYSPAQAYIALHYYPFTKPVYIYARNVDVGVSSGFITFLMSAAPGEGQKIVGDVGLVPASMPIRIVQTQKQNIK